MLARALLAGDWFSFAFGASMAGTQTRETELLLLHFLATLLGVEWTEKGTMLLVAEKAVTTVRLGI